MSLDPHTANMSAEAAARSLGVDNDEPSAALEYARGTGLAQLVLAIGVNRLADAVENFVGGAGPRPGLDELTGALNRMADAIESLSR
jgi:hypothetical protein